MWVKYKRAQGLLRPIIYALFMLEILYLIAANWFINSDYLHHKINKHPDRVLLNWQIAITPLPGFIWAKDFTLRTQTPFVQSLLEVKSLYGQLELTALRKRTLHAIWLNAGGIQTYVRPRPRPGRPLSPLYLHFPPIAGLKTGAADEIVDPASYVYATTSPWRIQLDNATLQQFDDVWIWNHRFKATGQLSGDLGLVTADRLWLENGEAELAVSNLKTNNQLVAELLRTTGDFSIEPYRARDHRGWEAIRFVTADLTLGGEILGLGFINYYLGRTEGLELNGSGILNARLSLNQGQVLPKSSFTVTAAAIEALFKDYRISGEGLLAGGLKRVAGDDEWQSELGIHFKKVGISHALSQQVGVIGSDLSLRVNGTLDALGRQINNPRIRVELPRGEVPDLAVFNVFLPEDLNLNIGQGRAEISATLLFDRLGLSLRTTLSGELKRSSIGSYQFGSRFESTLLLKRLGDISQPYLLEGSEFALFDASLATEKSTVKAWSTRIRVDAGSLLPDLTANDKKFKLAGDKFNLHGRVSDIGILNPLLAEVQGLGLGGAAELKARLKLEQGLIATGSTITMTSDQMVVDFLDQKARGHGRLLTEFENSSARQRIKLSGTFQDFDITAAEADSAHVENVSLKFLASGDLATLSDPIQGLHARLEIKDAKVPDLTNYNRYLPPASGMRFESGQGRLRATFSLKAKQVNGDIVLNTNRLAMRLRGQPIAGDLTVAAKLRNGSIERKTFDVGGSTLRLSGRRIDAADDQAPWSGRVQVERGRLRWKSPLAIDAKVKLHLTDTAPLLYLFAPEPARSSLVSGILSVKNVTGAARVGMDDRSAVLNNVRVGAGKLGLSAHLRFSNDTVDGVLYSKLGSLSAAVRINQGKRKWKWIGARKWYNSYSPFAIPTIK